MKLLLRILENLEVGVIGTDVFSNKQKLIEH
jgi:hypothetical protein